MVTKTGLIRKLEVTQRPMERCKLKITKEYHKTTIGYDKILRPQMLVVN